MTGKSYDFSGWVTKNDIRCSDGVTIRHNAFKDQDGRKVPLVWQHGAQDDPMNIIGHVNLENRPNGVYGYGSFNDTENGRHMREALKHGDIEAMSIGANKIQKQGSNVIHGRIYEVSLVMAGANPGALIENVMVHSDGGLKVNEDVVIYTDEIIHADVNKFGGTEMDAEQIEELLGTLNADQVSALNAYLQQSATQDDPEDPEDGEGENVEHADEPTIGDILDTFTPEQMAVVEYLVGESMSDEGDTINQSDTGGKNMKHNVFENRDNKNGSTLQHSQQFYNDALIAAKESGASSMKDVLLDTLRQSDVDADESTLVHGINNIEILFPEAHLDNPIPQIYKDTNTNAELIMAGVTKSPFARIKNRIADFTEDDARARGYIKGDEKIEQIFKVLSRETLPQTVYKKQKLDRDDLVDIVDFDVVSFINKEMRMMLYEELARAVVVGDGRQVTDRSKIKEENIRPIIKDDDFYTIKKTSPSVADFIETVIMAKAEYKGSGNPSIFADPVLVAKLRLLKATDGRFLFGDIPTVESIAARLGVKAIVETSFLTNGDSVMVNLSDYTLGATKGGQVTTFDDFDIDFNQHKYLIETRLSGALTMPKSAIYIKTTLETSPAPEGKTLAAPTSTNTPTGSTAK